MPRKKKITSYRKQRQHQRDYMRRKRYEEALYPAKKTRTTPPQTESNQGQCSKKSDMTIIMESGSSDSHMYTNVEQLGCKPGMKAIDENQGQMTKRQKKLAENQRQITERQKKLDENQRQITKGQKKLGVQKMKSSHRRTHKGNKRHKCEVCGKTFINTRDLQSHLRTHTKEKPYKCKQCGKAFSRSSSLIIHRGIHTGVKPYKCKHCGKEFRFSNGLIVHLRSHIEDKPYKCDVCGMAFKLSKSLDIHLERYKCDQFKNLVEKRTCDVCGRMYLAQSSLQTTGERQNTCDNCHRALSQNGSVTLVWV